MASLWEKSTPTTLRISLGLQIILPKMKPLDWDQDRKTAGTSNCSTKYTQLSWGMESTTEKYITTRVIIVHWNTVFDKFLTNKVYQILLSEWNHFFTYWHIQTVMQNDVDQNHVEFLPLPCSYLFPANRPVWIDIDVYIYIYTWLGDWWCLQPVRVCASTCGSVR